MQLNPVFMKYNVTITHVQSKSREICIKISFETAFECIINTYKFGYCIILNEKCIFTSTKNGFSPLRNPSGFVVLKR